MTNSNRFLLNLHRSPRMTHLSLKQKKKRIDKIMQDKDLIEILSPIETKEDSDYFYFYPEIDAVERWILAKQKEVEAYEKINNPTKQKTRKIKKIVKKEEIGIEIGRFGRTSLHEAVLSEDQKAVKYLLETMEKRHLFVEDNNKYNPFQLASLEEKKELIEIMRPYYIKGKNNDRESSIRDKKTN